MARRSFRRRFRSFRNRTRVIVKRVRSYRRPRMNFLQKNKMLVIVALVAGFAWMFRDKIKAMLPK